MSEAKVVISSRTNFTSVPNSFAQDKSISFEAKGLALFLQSLPNDWVIYPTWIQKKYGLTEWGWQKLAKELRKQGCLRLHIGGESKGSFYTFDLWNSHQELTTPSPVESRLSDKIARPRNPRDREKHVPYKETKIINKDKETTTRALTEEETRLVVELNKINISEKASIALIQQHGQEKIAIGLKTLPLQKLNNPAGYLIKMLKEQWIVPKNIVERQREAAILSERKTREMLDAMDAKGSLQDTNGRKWISHIKELLKMPPASNFGPSVQSENSASA